MNSSVIGGLSIARPRDEGTITLDVNISSVRPMSDERSVNRWMLERKTQKQFAGVDETRKREIGHWKSCK